MAFAINTFNPGMQPGARGKAPVYHSYKTTDTLATVLASGYFNSIFGMLESVTDRIFVQASNGDVLIKPTVASGVVTSEALETWGSVATETSTASALAPVGVSVMTSTSAKTFSLTAPFAGARKSIIKTSASTTAITVRCVSGVTVDGTNDDIVMNGANDAVVLHGLSTTRWLVLAQNSVTFS